MRGVGVSMDAFWTVTRSAKANEVDLPNRLLALDLGKLSRSCACRVDGLIGADFFRGRSVQIDFRASKVRLIGSDMPSAGEVALLDVRRCGMRVKAGISRDKSER